MNSLFQQLKEAAEEELSCSAHDMEHVMRVYNLALHLAEGESVDVEVLKAATLLHDIGRVKEDNDPSGQTDHALLGAEMSYPILERAGFSGEKIKHIRDCIRSHRYRTGHTPYTKEAQILFDADKLDALGAIGLARGFVWAGKNNARIYADVNLEKYIQENQGGRKNGRIKDKTKHAANIEFETKLKTLPEKLYTKRAREIGKERVRFYKSFLERLKKEINGIL